MAANLEPAKRTDTSLPIVPLRFAILLFVGMTAYLVVLPFAFGVSTPSWMAAEDFLRNVAPYPLAFAAAGVHISRQREHLASSPRRLQYLGVLGAICLAVPFFLVSVIDSIYYAILMIACFGFTACI